VKTRLDTAVKNGDLTQKQADAMLDRISEKVTAIGSAKGLRLRRHHHRFRGGPGPEEVRPGAFMPEPPDGPDIVMPADGVMD
jgi:hypothetical protein